MRSKDGVFFFCFSHAGHRRSMTGGGGNAISTRGPRLADACQDGTTHSFASPLLHTASGEKEPMTWKPCRYCVLC
jgi:hypothetical protein